jgi:two-component system, NarL family, sensor kinase
LEKETVILAVIVGTGILFVLIAFIYLSIIFYRKRYLLQEQEKEIIQSNFQQTLLQTQLEIQEQTLTNISQELHDNIGQTLSLAKLNLNTLKLNDTAKAQESINVTKGLISQSLVNIRDLAKSMLGEKITEIGLQNALQNEIKILEHTGKYEINFTTNENKNLLTPQQELVAFRIMQEAIHNIVKHAEATKIDVSLYFNTIQTTITITDNGKGFNTANLDESNTGVGLKNMKNRAGLINAELTLQSTVFQGTCFSLKINV